MRPEVSFLRSLQNASSRSVVGKGATNQSRTTLAGTRHQQPARSGVRLGAGSSTESLWHLHSGRRLEFLGLLDAVAGAGDPRDECDDQDK